MALDRVRNAVLAPFLLARLANSLASPHFSDDGKAAPPAGPALERTWRYPSLQALARPLSGAAGPTAYSIGDPTDDEQLYVEYINRARLDPIAEGQRLQNSQDPDLLQNYQAFLVDLAVMAADIAALPPAPPLSISPHLTTAARRHSQDMLANSFQGHTGSDGSGFDTRTTDAGYTWSNVGENVYAFAVSMEHGHAGFEVDWGSGPNTKAGMQDPPGHRLNIHNPKYREIGVGVIEGTNGDVGPQIVTQDFGSRPGLTPFITGVIYYDLNGNKLYDAGEGLGGADVLASASTVFGRSARSGGYSLPVSSPGTYDVMIRVSGLSDVHTNVVVADQNVKLDYALSYTPPAISGPDQPAVNNQNTYSFTSVGGATGYQWKWTRLAPATEVEGAENDLANVVALVTPGYAVVNSVMRRSGQNSFHLAHPRTGDTNSPPEDQIITFNRVFQPRPEAQLTFASRLSWASANQVARAQVSVDGASWQDVWTQAGVAGQGDTQFQQQTIPLGQFAHHELRLRMVYDYLGGGFFPQTDPGVGLYFDDVALTGTDEVVEQNVADLPVVSSFVFSPTVAGSFDLRVRPNVSARFLPWGSARTVTAQIGSAPSVRISSVQRLPDGRLQLRFTANQAGSGAYQMQSATDPAGPWALESGASVQSGGGSEFTAVVPTSTDTRRFFRVSSR